jgi:hypothetical protein
MCKQRYLDRNVFVIYTNIIEARSHKALSGAQLLSENIAFCSFRACVAGDAEGALWKY